jgi:hypothetical protein
MPDRMLQFFEYKHLPEGLQQASQPFHALALWVVEKFPQNPERTVCLRKLLEAKDAGVRTLVYHDEATDPVLQR